jgi:hypothetical protein
MIKHNQNGFGVVAIIAVLAVIALAVFIAYRMLGVSDSQQNQQTGSQQQSDDFALHNFGMNSLDSVLISNDATREYTKNKHKGFYFFGDQLADTGKINPNFEFASIKPDTKIISAIDGVVVHIEKQAESNDYEVFLQTYEGSQWMLAYDHLTNVQVKQGDTVKVGDELGEPAIQGNGLLRFEIQINKKQSDGNEVGFCPSSLLAADIKDDTLRQLEAMMQQWESTSGLELYDITAQSPVGCLGETVKP